ncbi:ScbR family autoregulator-binding transcription factor [Streptomyces sp. NPDC051561]|uniref:ScbR family autoregulator-binding transcription factor n=1 Tax=Streptomyces sp. NPDC051561 TaxID=3365658 RepID=UPI00378B4A41
MVRQERAVRTREAILVAAAKVFDEVGYKAATISQILEKSGQSKGALYFHFQSKEELAQAVLSNQLAAVPEVEDEGIVLQRVVDESLLLAHLLRSGDPLVRGSIRLTIDRGTMRDELDRKVPMQAWVDRGVELFEAAKENGEVFAHTDVESVARMFVSGFTGVQMLSSILTGHEDITERVAELHQHLMTAIAVPSVLVRLDFAPERAERVHEAAVRRRAEREQARAAEPAAAGV